MFFQLYQTMESHLVWNIIQWGLIIYGLYPPQIKIQAYISMTNSHDINDMSMSSMVCQHVTPSIWSCHAINGLKYITTIPRTSAIPRTINGV